MPNDPYDTDTTLINSEWTSAEFSEDEGGYEREDDDQVDYYEDDDRDYSLWGGCEWKCSREGGEKREERRYVDGFLGGVAGIRGFDGRWVGR